MSSRGKEFPRDIKKRRVEEVEDAGTAVANLQKKHQHCRRCLSTWGMNSLSQKM